MRKVPKRHRFTDERVRRTFPPPSNGSTTKNGSPKTQALYWDDKTEGFGLVVSDSNRSFIVQRWVDGKTKRVTLGRVGGAWKSRNVPADCRTDDVCSLKAAREAARKLYNRLGDDEPSASSVAAPAPVADPPSHTLREALDMHAAAMRDANREEKTIRDTERLFELHICDWLDLPLSSIEPEGCVERKRAIIEQGKATTAAKVFSRLEAVWNTSITLRPKTTPPNYAKAARNVKPPKQAEKQKGLSWDELPGVMATLATVEYGPRRDLWEFVLFTGLRNADACSVRWEHVNLTDETDKRDFGYGEVEIAQTASTGPSPKVASIGRLRYRCRGRRGPSCIDGRPTTSLNTADPMAAGCSRRIRKRGNPTTSYASRGIASTLCQRDYLTGCDTPSPRRPTPKS